MCKNLDFNLYVIVIMLFVLTSRPKPLYRAAHLHLELHHLVLLLCEDTHLFSRCGRLNCAGSLT